MQVPDDLLATEVTYVGKNVRGEPQDVRFFIDMMPFREGRDAWVNLRYRIAQAGVIQGFKPDTFQKAAINILDALMGIEPKVLEDIQNRQFKYIRFQVPGNNAMPLLGAEEMAFRGMPVVRAEELMVRSIAINFQSSLTAVLSAFGPIFQETGSPSDPPTQT